MIDTQLPATPVIRRYLYLQKTVSKILRSGDFDLLFSMSEIGAIQTQCPTVVLVHNYNFHARHSVFRSLKDRFGLLKYRLPRYLFVYLTLRNANWLVFVSETLREDIAGDLRFDLPRTSVIYHGLSDIFKRGDGSDQCSLNSGGGPYLLAVSTLAPHKNYGTLFKAFTRLMKVKNGSKLSLLVAGAINVPLHHSLLAQAESLGISDKIKFLGNVEFHHLPSLYQGAMAFIFPSRLESFGLPLIEAMGSGVPVIASNLPVCREICEDAARYFPPDREDILVDHILSLMREPTIREAMIDRGLRRAKHFSWNQTAKQFIGVFEEVAGG